MKNKQTQGAVLLLYVIIISFLLLLMIFGSQSRSILSVRRNQSSIDSLMTLYKSESIANDYVARILADFVKPSDFPFSVEYTEDEFEIDIKGFYDNTDQVVQVTSEKKFAIGTVEARRRNLLAYEYDHVDIIVSLDCTESMNAGASCKNCLNQRPTRFEAQEAAVIKFIDDLILLGPQSSKYSVGVQVFGGDAKWLKVNDIEATPQNNISLHDLKKEIQDGFGATRNESRACNGIIDVTSIGSPLFKAQEYFKTHKTNSTRQIEILVSDGLPNSRIPDTGCPESVFCPAFPLNTDGSINYCLDNEYGWICHEGDEYIDGPYGNNNFNKKAYNICQPLGIKYAACRLADTNTKTKETGDFGARDPDIETYVVVVFDNTPKKLTTMFKNYIGTDRFYNPDEADQLSGILRLIFEQITQDRSIITVKKIIQDN